jgi:hypothetical protein
LDNIDTYGINHIFDTYEEKICFDILKIPGNSQINHQTTDLIIENISQLENTLSLENKQKIVYSKSPKVVEKFLSEKDIS